jgi:cell division protein ZipA
MQLLYALGAVILLVLLFRAVQWLRESQRRLRVKLEKVPVAPDAEDNRHPELGKVRVRPRFEPDETGEEKCSPSASEAPVIVLAAADETDDVPLLQAAPDMPEDLPSASPHAEDEPEQVSYALSTDKEPAVGMPPDDHIPVLLTPAAVRPALEAAEQQDMFADEPIMLPPSRKPEPSRASVLYEKTIEPVRTVAAVAEEEKPHVDIQDVIALHVVARQNLFNGEDLLRSILAYGLRFGEMSIFHRHEQPTGQGRILFSMAKAVEPGTFDLEAMTGEEIPGVSFFLSLPGINSIHAYDIMVDTVKRLATDLNGEVLDEQQQVLTRQLIEHYRERVQEFERRRLMNRPAGH